MPLRTHRQRVPAMLAVACAGMLVYAVAGAAPDGRQLAPASCSSEAGPPAPGCVSTAAAKGDDKDPTPDKCEPTTTTTKKDGDKPTTSTTKKDGDKPTTSTTEKDGDKPTTSTTEKDGDKPTTSTTEKDGKGSTTTTGKDGAKGADGAAGKAGTASSDDLELNAAAAAKSDAKAGDDQATKAADDDSKTGKPADDEDCPTTTTTEKGGKGDGGKDTTTTTRKKGDGGKDDDKGTTTTTEKVKPTTSTTSQGGSVDSPSPGGGSSDPGGSADPGDTPISPQEAPPYDAPGSDPGPAEDPEAAADPGPVDSFDTWDDEDEVALDPMGAPGSGEMIPVFNEIMPTPKGKSSGERRERTRLTGAGAHSNRAQEIAAAPVASPVRSHSPAPGVTESAAVSRRLAGLQSSATESAFPASIISTPSEFPVNHRDPLAAAALVVLLGVSRELFKVWRRRATDYWPA